MNAFEDIVRRYLESEGYWVRQSVKVHISKKDKIAIGTPTMPTPEIDLVALHVGTNELLLVEAKSYLDSQGVYCEDITDPDDAKAGRYKLFTNPRFRNRVARQLKKEFLEKGLINDKTGIGYALAAGHIHSGDEGLLAEFFSQKGWRLFTPVQIKAYVSTLGGRGWEDDLVTMTAKLLKHKK